jgi:fluoroquinolone transport system ATP-binding protein
MIAVRNLYHDYEGKGRYAVSDLSFEIPKGRIFGFLGPSGAGKSTVQNLMTGLLGLQRGDIEYDGLDIRRAGRAFYNTIGYSFELPNLYGRLTGLENLRFYAALYSVPTEDPRALLDLVGLGADANKRAGRYSKGMKQRLVFARSLLANPAILFLDEPTSGLDPATAARIKQVIRDRKARGATIFLTTHNMHDAEALCDEVLFLFQGRAVARDTPASLKLAYGERSVRVELGSDGATRSEVLFLDRPEDGAKLARLVAGGEVRTLHTQEASLEQIFIRLTGQGLEA